PRTQLAGTQITVRCLFRIAGLQQLAGQAGIDPSELGDVDARHQGTGSNAMTRMSAATVSEPGAVVRTSMFPLAFSTKAISVRNPPGITPPLPCTADPPTKMLASNGVVS